MADVKCPVCDSTVFYTGRTASGMRPIAYYPCEKCGEYVITLQAKAALAHLRATPETAALISHCIRRLPRTGQEAPDDLPAVTTEFLDGVLKYERLPDPIDQVTNLILWLGEHTTTSTYRQVTPDLHQAVVGAAAPEGVWWAQEYLADEGLVKTKGSTPETRRNGSEPVKESGCGAGSCPANGWCGRCSHEPPWRSHRSRGRRPDVRAIAPRLAGSGRRSRDCSGAFGTHVPPPAAIQRKAL